jgi:integrase
MGLRTHQAAQKWERDMLDWRDGITPSLTFRDLAWLWLENVQGKRSARTIEINAGLLRLHILPLLGHRRLMDVRPPEVQLVVNELRGKARTANQCLSCIRAIYRQGMLWGVVPDNPSLAVARVPDPPKEADFLTMEEAEKLLGAAGEDRFLLLFMLCSGLRSGEVRELRWSDVEGRYIKIRKSKTAAGIRTVILPKGVALELQAQEKRGLYVFTRENGDPLGKYDLKRMLDKATTRAGLRHLTPHTLRHTYATWVLSSGQGSGGEVKALQELLGHAQASTTLNTYSHVLPGKKEAVVDLFEIEHASNLPQEQGEQDAEIIDIRR